MKSRSKELLDRAIAAMVAAIGVYNQPSFPYRAESFAILAINGWELLLKARWLVDNNNKERSLYVRERRQKADGQKTRKLFIKRTRSGNPFTHSLDFLGKKLVEEKKLDACAWANLMALMEMRDCAVHFYHRSPDFSMRLQEVGAATLKNFAAVVGEWFGRDLSDLNLYLMPLSFMTLPNECQAVMLNPYEKHFLAYLDTLESSAEDRVSPYSVSVNIEVKFTRSKAKDALAVQMTTDPQAPAVRLTEEQVREKYPWDYERLTEECRKRYEGFKVNQQYHDKRRTLQADPRFGIVRYLDPAKPNGPKKIFFNPNILQELDRVFQKKRIAEAQE